MFKRFRKWWVEVKDNAERRTRCRSCGRRGYKTRDRCGVMAEPWGWNHGICPRCQERARIRKAATEVSDARDDSFDPAIFLPALIPPVDF